MFYYHSGNFSYAVGVPDCASFAEHRAWHYLFLYYMPVMSFFAVMVNVWIITLLIRHRKKLLQHQSQHVYVLGSAITNTFVAFGANLPLWLAVFVIPCKDIGPSVCFVVNIINFAGGYQIMFNVCLVCYDRWRLVALGIQYSHTREVARAKRFLVGTSILSFLVFLVPEVATPLLTGVWTFPARDTDDQKCQASQLQEVPQLGSINPGDLICCAMIVLQWSIILIFALLTTWKLYRNMQRTKNLVGVGLVAVPAIIVMSGSITTIGSAQSDNSNASTATAQKNVAAERRMLRATLIMFGLVLATLVTFGPLAVVLALVEFDSAIITGWHQVQILLCLQWTSPALDPCVFAATLPKLRAYARNELLACLAPLLKRIRISQPAVTTGTSSGGENKLNEVVVGRRGTLISRK